LQGRTVRLLILPSGKSAASGPTKTGSSALPRHYCRKITVPFGGHPTSVQTTTIEKSGAP
ncbi:hypothetical protein, partial [Escherichia coli]|uniref:hypothetical protein n=1 Tax=Escherichia coli TaxID=562 RepID=UPI0019533720